MNQFGKMTIVTNKIEKEELRDLGSLNSYNGNLEKQGE